MTHKPDITDPLDHLFAKARAETVEASPDLLARVLDDGLAAMPDPVQRAPAVPEPISLWAGFWDLIGGWPSATGLAASCIAGLWLGIMPPQGLSTLIDTAIGAQAASWLDTLDEPDLFSEVSG